MRLRSKLLIAALALGSAFAAEDAPAWMKDLASTPVTGYPAKVNAVMLLNEESNAVDGTGKIVRTTRSVVKYIARQADVQFLEHYDTDGGKVRDFRAWVISASGKVKRYGKDEILDVACAANDIYNQCRMRAVFGKGDAEPGAVFGYEAVVEERDFSNQLLFHFQDSMPVKLARFNLTLPAGWEIQAKAFNGAPKETNQNGVFSWQMENLPPIEREPDAPAFATITPWIGVNLLSSSSRAPANWEAVSKAVAELNQSQYDPNDAIAAKAKALTAGATTELDKIRAIGKFTQQINYVSIQTNLASGGGYRPHAATQVFQKLYGDCKDKANLTRSMLKAVGIEAYPVAIYSGDRTHVQENWPSLGEFNHAISAIRVGPETKGAAVFEHPKLGRLMFFDSTDPYVEPGYIPDHEQSSLALIAAAEGGGLVRVPSSPPDPSTHLIKAEAELKADGGLSGSFTETRTGEAYSQGVAETHGLSKADFQKYIERWVGYSISGATVSGIEAATADGSVQLKANFASTRFAQTPQSRMMIIRGGLLKPSRLHFQEKSRKYPVVLDSDAFEETVRIVLPAGFKVDEMPDPVKVDSEFGKFEATWTAELGAVKFTRKLAMRAQTVPTDRYQAMKKFMDVAYGSGDAPVVLIRQ